MAEEINNEGDKTEFGVDQAAFLDAMAPGRVDLMEAEELGVITREIREAIQENLGVENARRIFERVYEKELVSRKSETGEDMGLSRKLANRAAWLSVFKRPFLDQGVDENLAKDLSDKLKGILKLELPGDPNAIKLRGSLAVALDHLQKIGKPEHVKAKRDEKVEKLEQEIDGTNKKLGDLKAVKDFLEGDEIAGIDKTEKFKAYLDDLEELHKEHLELRHDSADAEKRIEELEQSIEQLKQKMGDLENEIMEKVKENLNNLETVLGILSSIQQAIDSENDNGRSFFIELNSLEAYIDDLMKLENCDNFAEIKSYFDEFDFNDFLISWEDLEKSLNDNRNNFTGERKTQIAGDIKALKLFRKSFDLNPGVFSEYDRLNEEKTDAEGELTTEKERLSGIEDNVSENDGLIEQKEEEILEFLSEHKKFLTDLSEKLTAEEISALPEIYSNLTNNINSKCSDLSKKLQSLIDDIELNMRFPVEIYEELKIFWNNEYKPFIESLDEPVSELKAIQKADNDDEVLNLDAFETTLERLKQFDPKEAEYSAKVIINEAFADANPGKVEEYRSNVEISENNLKNAREALNYFRGRELSNLSSLFNQLKNSAAEKTAIDAAKSYGDITIINDIAVLESRNSHIDSELTAKNKNGELFLSESGKREDLSNEKNNNLKDINALKKMKDYCGNLYSSLDSFLNQLLVLEKIGMLPGGDGFTPLKKIREDLSSLDTTAPNFTANQILEVYAKAEKYLTNVGKPDFIKTFFAKIPELEKNVKTAKQDLKNAETLLENSRNLTDAQAAKKVILKLLEKEYPDMPAERRNELATAVLMNDLDIFESNQSYLELAKQASADLLDTGSMMGLKEKVIGLKYKDSEGKVHTPFKGLKPEDLKDNDSIDRLFDRGVLNLQKGFMLYKALDHLAGENSYEQTLHLKSKLQFLIAKAILEKQHGKKLNEKVIKDKMLESNVRNLVSKAFEGQINKVSPIVENFSAYYDKNEGRLRENFIASLELKYERLSEKLKLKKISQETFRMLFERDCLNPAREYGVLDKVSFVENSFVAGLMNSPKSQWIKDRFYNAGLRSLHGLKDLAGASIKTYARATWRVGALGLRAFVHAPLAVGYRGLGYLKAPLWIFRKLKNRGAPSGFKEKVKKDAERAKKFFKKRGGEVKKSAKNLAEDYKKAGQKILDFKPPKGYAERTKVNLGSLDNEIAELVEMSEPKPVDVNSDLSFDVDSYVSELNEIEGKTDEPEQMAA